MMENKERVERLKKEIEELDVKDKEKKELEELFAIRNRLKYKKLYHAGEVMKKMGNKLADWAEAKNKQNEEMQEDEDNSNKTKKPRQNKPVDVYEALFGEDELTKGMNNELF